MSSNYCQSPDCTEGSGGNPGKLEGRQRKYCSPRCRSREHARRKRGHTAPSPKGTQTRRGDTYDALLASGWVPRIRSGDLSIKVVAKMMGVSEHNVAASLRAIEEDAVTNSAAAEWVMDKRYQKMLGPLEAPEDPAEFEAFLDDMVAAFIQFRDEFFLTPLGDTYITEDFHAGWIKSTLRTIYTGGANLILSPPRHGKSDLLVHFCVWLILRNPNIRIAWIGGNKDIAADMVTAVRDHLEDERLVEAFLPPGTTFKPQGRSAGQWQATKFRVANRTIVGIKASTMTAIGREGKILSRDMDFIIADDIEDHESVLTDGSRHDTRRWFMTQVHSRKEEHTGLVIIGSRQHHEDLYAYLFDNPDFETIVDQAHADECMLDPNDEPIHVECMLFPRLRTYRWLMTKKRAAEALGQPELYEMVYLNHTIAEGALVFSKDEITNCFNPERNVGIPDLVAIRKLHAPTEEGETPAVFRKIAGLDPSYVNRQAAFAWGWLERTERLWAIDLDNQVGGGAVPALEIITSWHQLYDIRHWVIEDNLYRGGIQQDPRIVEYCREHMILLEPHQTQMNKHDKWFGVTSMVRLFREQLIDLPFATPEARAKFSEYRRQLVNYSDKAGKATRGRTSDILMASWFPMLVIRRWQMEIEDDMDSTNNEFEGWERALNDLAGIFASDRMFSTAPW